MCSASIPKPDALQSAVCTRQTCGKGATDWKGIEAVLTMWKDSTGKVLPLLLTNKLRIQNPSASVSTSAAAQAHVSANEAGFKEGEYYVVAFTCDNKASVSNAKPIPGTIFVPGEGVSAMLSPVGGSALEYAVGEKLKAPDPTARPNSFSNA